MQLKKSKLSIISCNCFGGFLYHKFNLPFLSPLINMFIRAEQFIKMVSNLKEYMKYPIKFYDIKRGASGITPVYLLNDIELNMNHYNNFDYAEAKWNERVKRINWDNLLIEMHTDSEKLAEIFDSLPYNKKACLVSFKSNLKSAFYLPFVNDNKKRLVEYTWGLAKGNYPFYDMWDLMMYGKKTPRIDF